MINIGVAVIIMALAVIMGCCINWYVNYDYYRSYCNGIISFDRFLEIYKYSNNTIYLADTYFYYEHYSESDFCVKTYYFYFTIPDTFRYERWLKKIKRKEEKEKADAIIEEVEKLWAEDAANATNATNATKEKANVDQMR